MRLWKVDTLNPMISSSRFVVVLIIIIVIGFLPPIFVMYGSGDGWEEDLATFGYKLDIAVVLLYFELQTRTCYINFGELHYFKFWWICPYFFHNFHPFVYVEIS